MPRKSRHAEAEPSPETYTTLSPEDPDAWPRLVAFDLDYTLWDLWIDTHVTPPLKRHGNSINKLTDRRGQPIEFYREVPSILAELSRRNIHIAACSRTSAPELAREALGRLLLSDPEDAEKPIRAITYFNSMEIYPGSKLRHFKEIHRKTGIPYDQMLFFDDEHRNFDVEFLGITMHLVPHTGTDRRLWDAGLALWRRRRAIRTSQEI